MQKWKLYVVPHTHWDKEWYFTKHDSEVLLLENFKTILNKLEYSKQMTFTLDGQVSIVDDYLSYKVEDYDLIKKFINNKQLIIGPWYTQPDFFNSTSETVVRNLLFGINFCKKISDNYLDVAYVPDSFGHNDQMPQIYKEFGLKSFIYWRGISKKILEENGIVNLWKGVDDSLILSYNMLYGYWSFGSNYPYKNFQSKKLSVHVQEFLKNTKPLIEKIKANTKVNTNKVLIPLGGDQAPIAENLEEFISEINRQDSDGWFLSDYSTFMNDLKNDVNNFSIISGELKKPFMSRIHRTIGSQRQDIKQLLKKIEIEYYNNLQPLLVAYFDVTKEYPSEIDKKIMRKILSAVAHDSIGGCNSDRTNQDIKNRLSQCQDLILSTETKIMKIISENINLKNEEIILYNPSWHEVSLSKKIIIFSKFKNIKLILEKNKSIDYEIISSKKHSSGMLVQPSIQGEKISICEDFYEHEIYIRELVLNPQEFLKFKVNEQTKTYIKNHKSDVKVWNNWIGLKDKFQVSFEAEEDLGDSYDFSPNSEIKEIINKFEGIKKIKLKNNFENKYELIYSIRSKENSKKIIKQKFYLSFFEINNEIIDLQVKTKNLASEIRWRIILKDLQSTGKITSDQCYSVVKKENNDELKNWKSENWKEAPVNIHSFESGIFREGGWDVFTNDLNEYEIFENNMLALTLYRSVSSLGRNNLVNRPGRASGTSEFNISTNDTKFLNHEFEFNFRFSSKPKFKLSNAKDFINSALYYQNQSYNNLYKNFDRFLLNEKKLNLNLLKNYKINDKNFVIKTIKPAENDDTTIIMRGFNSSFKIIKLEVYQNNNLINFDVCNLLEEVIEKNKNTIDVKPKKIITIKIRRE